MARLKWWMIWLLCLATVVTAENKLQSPEQLALRTISAAPSPTPLPTIVDNTHTIRMSDDGRFLVTLQKESGDIRIRDLHGSFEDKRLYLGTQPELLGMYGNLLYVAHQRDAAVGPTTTQDLISIVNMSLGRLVGRIPNPSGLEGLFFDKRHGRLLITNARQHTLSAFSAVYGRHLKTVSLHHYGKRPRGVSVAADGRHTLVTLEGSGKFVVLDDKLRVLKSVNTADGPYAISFTEDARQIYVSTGRDKLLQVFDAVSDQKQAEIPVETGCWQFSFNSASNSLLLACQQPAQILVIQTDTYQISKRLPMPGLPLSNTSLPADAPEKQLADAD